VNKSAILKSAIKNAISRSPHPHLAESCEDQDDIQPQFVGFISAQIQDNVVTALHIHSFALYYTQTCMLESKPLTTTVVICAHTFSHPHFVYDAGSRVSIDAAVTT
jgi:hypothetical protein